MSDLTPFIKSNPWLAKQNHIKLAKQDFAKGGLTPYGVKRLLDAGVRLDNLDTFHPQKLFAGGAAGLLWHVHPGTCFKDVAGTENAQPGDPVALLYDLSGNGIHASQATEAARPTLNLDLNGRYYLNFDGVDDYLEYTFTLPSTMRVAMGIARGTAGEDSPTFCKDDATNVWYVIHGNGASTTLEVIAGTFTSLEVDGVNLPSPTRADIGTAMGTDNRVTEWEYGSITETNTGWWFGKYASSDYFGGKVYSTVKTGALSAANQALLASWIADDAGVTL